MSFLKSWLNDLNAPGPALRKSIGLVLAMSLLLPRALPVRAGEPPRVVEREGGLESGAWVAQRGWDEAAEQEFGEWIQALGEAREKKSFRMGAGLRNPECNPLFTEEDSDLKLRTDCANLAYALRAYFAYKTRRPFAYVGFTWKRYAAGNHPRDIKDWTRFPTFRKLFSRCVSTVSSGHFRMSANLEATDTYPISITPECVRPGVVYYDPNGHVLIVYKVDYETGEIRMFDSHPDGTLTRKTFNDKLKVGSARFGGGFRRWRHDRVEVVDPETGAFRLVRDPNASAPCFSPTDQYRGTYLVDGKKVSYHEWVRHRISEERGPVYSAGIEARSESMASR